MTCKVEALPSVLQEYIDFVRSGEIECCKDQFALCDYVEKCFREESIYVDEEQLQRYLNQQKYFPFKLFPWEKFVFALHNCTYSAPGVLRWPILLEILGRGSGKNGYISFESFCWLTPVNGIKEYHTDIFAMSEDQASTSFNDVYNVLEDNKDIMEKYFEWNKEVIRNKKTRSELRFRTSGYKTKDGGRPGAIIFDEYHAYESYKLIDVATTGLGKKRMPRQTIITTDGHVRGGPLDDLKKEAEDILYHGAPDNGMLPFICRLDDRSEVDDQSKWTKANPSLIFFPALLTEMIREYHKYKKNPSGNSSFMVKRMNLPMTFEDQSVTDWNNILATDQEVPDLTGCKCVGAIDYARTTDMITAGCLFLYKEQYIWITHTWVCKRSPDLPYIKAPLEEWEEKDLLTFVDDVEVSPELPVEWLEMMAEKYQVTVLGLDSFRYALLSRTLKAHGFDTDKGGANNVLLTKRVTQMRYAPVITSLFNNHRVIFGDNPLMRWFTNNTCLKTEAGNQYFAKKEEKSRKTDGFMAFVSAVCASENLEDCGVEYNDMDIMVYSY